MGKEKKKQHYVPRGYLEQWSIPGRYQVYVYNKKQKKVYLSSINDIASERYFYDIDFTGILTEDDLKKMGLPVCDPKHIDDEQYIENFFSKEIEDDLKRRLVRMINRGTTMSPWEIRNCYFLSEVDKFYMSFHLAYQYIRVKSIRTSISDSSDCLRQVLEDLGASQESIDKYTVPKSHLPLNHGEMILDKEEIDDLSRSFFSLTWILLVNKTDNPFFTSDNPIGTIEHIHHPILSMAGLDSRGVEGFYPLSPRIMLLMLDGEYHKEYQGSDRRVDVVDNKEVVKYYNSRCVSRSDNCIFSATDDFSVIDEMLAKNPEVLDEPHTVVNWGGKTYTPQKDRG